MILNNDNKWGIHGERERWVAFSRAGNGVCRYSGLGRGMLRNVEVTIGC